MMIDFQSIQMKPLLCKLITQIVLPLDDKTKDIKKGDKLNISFDNNFFRNYCLIVTNVAHTNLFNLTSKDIIKNGFLWKSAFMEYMLSKHMEEHSSIVKLDFVLKENEL